MNQGTFSVFVLCDHGVIEKWNNIVLLIFFPYLATRDSNGIHVNIFKFDFCYSNLEVKIKNE